MRVVLVLFNVWLTIGLFSLADDYNLSREMFGKWFIVIALGFISTVVHEGGHAVAAWQVGFKVKRIAVLPIEFDMARKRFGWASLPSKSDIAGYVQADVPINAGRRSAVIFALGGPLAEAALAVGLFAAITLAGTVGDSHGIGSAMVFAERASASQAGLPSDAELQSGIDGMIGRRHEEIFTWTGYDVGYVCGRECLDQSITNRWERWPSNMAYRRAPNASPTLIRDLPVTLDGRRAPGWRRCTAPPRPGSSCPRPGPAAWCRRARRPA